MFPGTLVAMDRPSIRTSLRNFVEYDAPVGTKLRMALTNNLTKLRTHSQCCGHPGQPGC
ncbi:MAG TPA: hypothetical protein VH112_05995 [Acidimicrobiales bacterium]|nr:hypothetical protein [Acidimicrobiales bacterium]